MKVKGDWVIIAILMFWHLFGLCIGIIIGGSIK